MCKSLTHKCSDLLKVHNDQDVPSLSTCQWVLTSWCLLPILPVNHQLTSSLPQCVFHSFSLHFSTHRSANQASPLCIRSSMHWTEAMGIFIAAFAGGRRGAWRDLVQMRSSAIQNVRKTLRVGYSARFSCVGDVWLVSVALGWLWTGLKIELM